MIDNPRDVFFALGERTVDGEHLVVLGPQHGCGARRMQSSGEHPCPADRMSSRTSWTFRMIF